jgi:hypothetical protein
MCFLWSTNYVLYPRRRHSSLTIYILQNTTIGMKMQPSALRLPLTLIGLHRANNRWDKQATVIKKRGNNIDTGEASLEKRRSISQ